MGTVIRFPNEKRALWSKGEIATTSASIIILPVVRIERHEENGSELLAQPKRVGGRRRRRRSSDLERDAS